jgi:hypothetical protein
MPEPVNLKRPSAHRWVIGLLCVTIVASVIVLSDIPTGRAGASWRQYWREIALLSASAFALFCLIVGGRHRWAYYITSGLLGIYAFRGICNLLLYAWLLAFGKRPLNINHFQFSQHGQPFYVQQVMFVTNYLGTPLVVAFFVWMFIRFTFTRESRSYFQFKKSTGNDSGEPDKSTKQDDEAPTLT